MNRWSTQLVCICLLAVLGAGLNYLIVGPPDRGVVCDPAKIESGEVCLQTIEQEWRDEAILWIDARSRTEFDQWHMEGAQLLNTDPNENFDELLATAAPLIAGVEKVVVYCSKAGCGASKEIAKQLREYQLGPAVYSLYGGMNALKKKQ